MQPSFRHRERGAVLIVALLFLVILTMLGVTAMTSTTMEERMAGNARDASIAFQAAEAALRDGRRDLGGAVVTGFGGRRTLPAGWSVDKARFGVDFVDGTCNTLAGGQGQGLCLPTVYVGGEAAVLPPLPNHSMTAAPSVLYGQFTGALPLVGVSQQPRYIVELFCLVRHDEGISDAPHCNFLRITAVGYGVNPNTRVTLQEIIAKAS